MKLYFISISETVYCYIWASAENSFNFSLLFLDVWRILRYVVIMKIHLRNSWTRWAVLLLSCTFLLHFAEEVKNYLKH